MIARTPKSKGRNPARTAALLVLTGFVFGPTVARAAAPNMAPNPLSVSTIDEDANTPYYNFVVVDPDNPSSLVTVTKSSNNTDLLPVNRIDLATSDGGTNYTFRARPLGNKNGTATVTLVATDPVAGATTNSFDVVVRPKDDHPTITGTLNSLVPDNTNSIPLDAVVIGDIDQDNPIDENLLLQIDVPESGNLGLFEGMVDNSRQIPGLADDINSALDTLIFIPEPNISPVGTTNIMDVVFTLSDYTAPVTLVTGKLSVVSINDLPEVDFSVSPSLINDNETAMPFVLAVDDPDLGEEFTVQFSVPNDPSGDMGTIEPTPATITGFPLQVANYLSSLRYTPAANVISNSTAVTFQVIVSDKHGGVVTNTASMTLREVNNAPAVYGVSPDLVRTDDTDSVAPFTGVLLQDLDRQGQQLVDVTLTVVNPAMGILSETSITGYTPSNATAWIRGVDFMPSPNAVPVGIIETVALTIEVNDGVVATVNSETEVAITGVDGAPVITGMPLSQPLPVPPADPRPFAELYIIDDVPNDIDLSIRLDAPTKGDLVNTQTNMTGFAETASNSGIYTYTGPLADVNTLLTNLEFQVNSGYPFPQGQTGKTKFTLVVEDELGNIDSEDLEIVLQEFARNIVVTRTEDDLTEGSLRYALSVALPNDTITFALSDYPALIRLKGTNSLSIAKHLTIKGPGADQLTISGDTDGDQIPDLQIFRIFRNVTLEGLTLSHGYGRTGGAVYVGARGTLTLRECVVKDSMADLYGGGIDAEEGALHIEQSLLLRNTTGPATGLAGGAVSIYSDADCSFVNTTFSGNTQAAPTGFGGGALYVENLSPATLLWVDVQHCTFVENTDAVGAASALLAVGSGNLVGTQNSLYGDGQGRNLEVEAAGMILSLGGNIADDSTYTTIMQGGAPQAVFLLDDPSDITLAMTPLVGSLTNREGTTPVHPLPAGSPAIGSSLSPLPRIQAVDQRGHFRDPAPDRGAYEYLSLNQVVINEVMTKDLPDDYVEVYIPRSSVDVDLSGFELRVAGDVRHVFAPGTVIKPGRGIIVADSVFPAEGTPPTPVVVPALTNLDLGVTGILSITTPSPESLPVAAYSYNDSFLFITNVINSGSFTNDALTLHPQFQGYAYLPHSFRASGTSSPGADSDGTGFGAKNAKPVANNDRVLVGEDAVAILDVLDNDRDRDRTDTLLVVGVPATPTAASGWDAVYGVHTNGPGILADTVRYDPRYALPLQSLPEGAEVSDGLTYRIADLGGGSIEDSRNAGGSRTLLVSPEHRLATGDVVRISDTVGFNGLHTVVVSTNDNQFVVDTAFTTVITNGTWAMLRDSAEADVEVIVIGQNDPPVPGLDTFMCNEDEVVRMLADPDLLSAGVTFETDAVYGSNVTLAATNLLVNDTDIDTDDNASTLKVVGVLDRTGAVLDYTGTPGTSPVQVQSPSHGLTNGVAVLISGYTGHGAYNGFHPVTRIDDDQFSIPVDFVGDVMTNVQAGAWGVLDDGDSNLAGSALGANVHLEIRVDRAETSLVYDPRGSTNLNALAVGETALDVLYYAVEDRHQAVSIGQITFTVHGVNDTPIEQPDPGPIDILFPFVGPSNTLVEVISTLTVLDAADAASGTTNRRDVRVVPEGLGEAENVVLLDVWATTEDLDLVIPVADLLANDHDHDDSDVLGVTTAMVSRAGAPVTLDTTGSNLTFRASSSTALNALAHGELWLDSFDAVISDAHGGIVTGTVAVLVRGVNDTPEAIDDYDVTFEDVLLPLYPLYHTTNVMSRWDREDDINGTAPDDVLWTLPQTNELSALDGRVNINGENRADYDPSVSAILNQLADWQSTTDRFDYVITDQSLVYACDDIFRVEADDSGLTFDVLANDRNFNHRGGALSIIAVGLPDRNGTVAISTNNVLEYTPEVNFVGDEVFTYTVTDPYGNIHRARVTARVTLESRNGALQVNDDFFAVASGETVTLNVRANDHRLPASGASLSVIGVETNGTSGTVEWSGDVIRYTYNGPTGQDMFTYTVSGGGTAEDTATVSLQVVNRENVLPVRDDCYRVAADSLGNVLDVVRNDRILPDTRDVVLVGLSATSSYSSVAIDTEDNVLSYSPQPGFVGRDEFTYKVTDNLGGTGYGRVTVLVGSLLLSDDAFTVPFNSTATTADDGPVMLDVLGNDQVLPGVTGTLSLVDVTPATAAFGSMGFTSERLVFTPLEGAVGATSFVYRVEDVSDGVHRMREGTVQVSIGAVGIHANPDTFRVQADGETYVLNVLLNDASVRTVPQNLALVSIGSGPDAPNRGGTVVIREDNASLVYTPAEGFVGEETFTYTVSDSLGTDAAKVVVRVSKPEIASCDDAYMVYFDQTGETSFTLSVLDNDTLLPNQGGLMLITGTGMDDPGSTNAPNQGGTVSIAPDAQSLVYTPDAAYAGSFPYEETFTYEISDGTADRAEGLVRVSVRQRSGALQPDTHPDRFSVERNSMENLLPVLDNDGILPGTAAGWSITDVSVPEFGGLALVEDRHLRYTPAPGFLGTERFGYTVSDGLGGTATAGVAVVVGDILLNPDCFTVLSGTTAFDLDVLHNDGVLPATNYVLNLGDAVDSSEGGTLSITNEQVRYLPDPAYAGTYPYRETFVYSVLDDSSLAVTQGVSVLVLERGSDMDTGTVYIHVDGVNDPPTITNETSVVEITDKEAGRPFLDVDIDEVDEQHQEQISVTVHLDPVRGILRNLSGFTEIADGVYSNAGTAAEMNLSIRQLIFDPTENRITVPTSEVTVFTIEATDHKWPVVITDTSSRVNVTAVNDIPKLQGTVAGQKVYYRSALRPFTGVTVIEVDDLTLQPLDITVSLDHPEQGVLQVLGGFSMVTGGVYRLEGATAAEASTALRNLAFVPTTDDRLLPGGSEITRLTIEVDDRFAAPVVDAVTTVEAVEGYTQKVWARANGEADDQFGFAVAAQFNEVITGAPYADRIGNNSGAVYVYRRDQGGADSWGEQAEPQAAVLTGGDRLGTSVALDGDLAVSGAPYQTVGGVQSGVVYIFERNQDGADQWGWSTNLLPVNAAGTFVGTPGDEFGASVAAHGDLVAVGAPLCSVAGTRHGAIFLFDRHQGGPNAWGLVARIIPGDGDPGDLFGAALALDGETLVVGAPGVDDQGGDAGALYVFARHQGGADTWGEIQKIKPAGNDSADELGRSVALDGEWLAGGAPLGDRNGIASGLAYVYRRTAPGVDGWTFQNAYQASDAEEDDEFGRSIALENGLLAVGAPQDDINDEKSGSVYLFAQNVPGLPAGLQREKRVPPDADNLDEFGFSVSLRDGVLAMGARRLDINLIRIGAVYIYQLAFDNPPLAGEPLIDQFAEIHMPFGFSLPEGAFGDSDAGDDLVLSATFSGVGPLGWLHFEPSTGTFQGLPTSTGSMQVLVTATDESGHAVSQVFTVWTVDPAVSFSGPNPWLEAWRRSRFSAASLADPAQEATVWGNGSNWEGDALTVIEEYVYGYDPNVDDVATGPLDIEVSVDPTSVLVSYNRRTDDPLLVYEVDYAAQLGAWQSAEFLVIQESAVQLDASFERVTLKLSREALVARFYRVRGWMLPAASSIR